jgi:hypothetical protein
MHELIFSSKCFVDTQLLSDYASNALLLERLVASASAVSTLSNHHLTQKSTFIFARLS